MNTKKQHYLNALGIEVWQIRTSNKTNASTPTRQEDSLETLRALVSHCTACPLHTTRTQTVFGTGNPHADLMIISDSPGLNEDQKGEPFVGLEGQLLNAMLQSIGINREQVYLTTILKCRPSHHDTLRQGTVRPSHHNSLQQAMNHPHHNSLQQETDHPSHHNSLQQETDHLSHHNSLQQETDHLSHHNSLREKTDHLSYHHSLLQEMNLCTPFLEKQIEFVRPKLILCLGEATACYLLKTNDSLKELRGKFNTYCTIPLLVSYSVSHLLKNPKDKRHAFSDLHLVLQLLQKSGNSPDRPPLKQKAVLSLTIASERGGVH
jgi:uracil-DNA glycosylase